MAIVGSIISGLQTGTTRFQTKARQEFNRNSHCIASNAKTVEALGKT